ncbi:growth-regulated alpha protein-like isoform X3 [Poecilia reticulata]|uniref:growth-regulated alpha protein-like isoform X3 n=1 Tax=Poecilia reticulata TaxID=8081 RepID=UPI0007EC1BEB|nr:PREDICTED: growth-regulated alpha protein-like isoform X3 [Poecilia reticulata]
MKSAIQCIVLLACIAVCTSNSVGRCRCIKTIPAVRNHLISDVKVYEPTPACHKREVIAIMTDNRQRCLDPESNFTKRLLMAMQKNAEGNLSTTTAAATTLEALRSQPPEPAEEVDLLTWLTWDPTAN